MSTVEDRLVDCFALTFPELAPDEIRRASMASVATWDSVAAINLVTVIEEEFGVELAVEEIGEIASFATVLDLLTQKLA